MRMCNACDRSENEQDAAGAKRAGPVASRAGPASSVPGPNLTDYVRGILEREVTRPPAEEVFERVAGRSAVDLEVPAAELIRRERELRDAS